MTDKICKTCKESFVTSTKKISCDTCKRKRQAEYMATRRARLGIIKNPGVGKGGANKCKEEDDQFKTGIAWFQKNRKAIKEEMRFCAKCDKDLIDASRYMWVIHHIDHDRAHNNRENLILLCKRCHQVEHDCHLAFGKKCRD